MRKIKILIPIIIFLIVVIIGVVKVNIINTKALSERNDEFQGMDLEKIKDEFGEEFSNFITDKSTFKIHEKNNENYIVEFNGEDYEVNGVLGLVRKAEISMEYLYEKLLTLIE